MTASAQPSRAFDIQNAPLVTALLLALSACNAPALVRLKKAPRDAPVTVTLALEGQRFVATVTNTGNEPVTLSPSPERIFLDVEGLTAVEPGAVSGDKPSYEPGETDGLFWLYPGESRDYHLDARIRKGWRGWVFEKRFLSGDSDDLSTMEIPRAGMSVVAWYTETRYRTEMAASDPFFKCCNDVAEGIFYCGKRRPDLPFRCGHRWIGDEYTFTPP